VSFNGHTLLQECGACSGSNRSDNTLGAEGSVVTPDEHKATIADGGAPRGTKLFHSFLEFNVGKRGR